MLTISELCYWIWAASYAAKWLVLTHAVMWLSRQIITPLPTMSDALLSIYVSPNICLSAKKLSCFCYHPWSLTNLITLGHRSYPLSIHMLYLLSSLCTLTFSNYVSLFRCGMRGITASSAGFFLLFAAQ